MTWQRRAGVAVVILGVGGCSQRTGGPPVGPSAGQVQIANTIRFESFGVPARDADATVSFVGGAGGTVTLEAFNLGTVGEQRPVSTMQVVVQVDPTYLVFQSAAAADGWQLVTVQQDAGGGTAMTFGSTRGDVRGDARIATVQYGLATGARPGDTPLVVDRLWRTGGTIAYDARGRFAMVNVYGGGLWHLTEE